MDPGDTVPAVLRVRPARQDSRLGVKGAEVGLGAVAVLAEAEST